MSHVDIRLEGSQTLSFAGTRVNGKDTKLEPEGEVRNDDNLETVR